MKLLAQQTLPIRRDVRTVFSYVSNMENFAAWFPGVRSITPVNPAQPIQLGKEYREVVATPTGEERQILLRVTGIQPERLFVTEGEYPPLLPRMEISLATETSNDCVVTWKMLSRNEAPESEMPWLPAARKAIEERAKLGMMQLKERLEQGSRG